VVIICPDHLNNLQHYNLYLWVLYFSLEPVIISLNSIKKLTFVMVKLGILFEVQTEFLKVIHTSFSFKGLILNS
jgi:hypothetical protein